MKILALEFSSPQRSVAIIRRDEFHESPSTKVIRRDDLRESHDKSPSNLLVTEIIESGNAVAPFTMIENALREATLEREQIDCIVVGLGPGSYTGIRAAISIVQGWQLARGTKLMGISSAEGIAAQAQADGATGRVNVIVDAQREEFYLAAYELTSEGCHESEPLKIVDRTVVQKKLDAGEVLLGPEVTRWFPSGKTVFPRAAILGRLAQHRTDFIAGEKIEPIYLRETKFVKAPPPRVIS
jgi:tRNA threonylcarbamoyl adenosine modification protein YeaZ